MTTQETPTPQTHTAHDGIYPMLPGVIVFRHVTAYFQRHTLDPDLTTVWLQGGGHLVVMMTWVAFDRCYRSEDVDVHCLRLQT